MNKPKMIIFDYGQTLVHEDLFNGIKGTEAVLANCMAEGNGVAAEEVQKLADEINTELDRFNPESRHLAFVEIHEHPFQNYLYEYFGLKRTVSMLELETVFWNTASPGRTTHNIVEFLQYLKNIGMRTAVISNIAFSGEALNNRISRLLPDNEFEFVIASSEYVFRKPSERIFTLAARKARLEPKDLWYCGDNAICDIDGAKNAGIFPVWYKGAHIGTEVKPKSECLTIYDWMELKKVLEECQP